MNHSFDNFSAADFLLSDEFVSHQLEQVPETALLWEQWLASNPPNLAEWKRAVHLLESIRLGLGKYAENIISEEAIEALLERIRETNQRSARPVQTIGRMRWLAAAAVVLLSSLLGYWWMNNRSFENYYASRVSDRLGEYTERVNDSRAAQTILLPDSSVVQLAPGSKISFKPAFDAASREVFLSGEADFKVVRNVQRPFLVYANQVVTRVLGTQFRVRAFDKEAKVLVNVSSGQVSVSRDERQGVRGGDKPQPAGGLLLLPNQQAVFSRQSEEFSKSIVPEPRVVSAPAQMPTFEYDAVPVSRVIGDMEKAYGISILFNKEQLKNCELSASLKTETFEEKLRVICTTINADYQKLDGQVVIHGGECR